MLITARSDDFLYLKLESSKKNWPDPALGPRPVGKHTEKSVMNNKMLWKYYILSIQYYAFSAELVCVYLVFKLEG